MYDDNVLNQARYIVLQKYPDMKPKSVFKYEKLYVFMLVYKSMPEVPVKEAMVAVDVDRGEAFTFLPTQYDLNKYLDSIRSTKRIL